MPTILKLNEISPVINGALPKSYTVSTDSASPDAIMVRSFNMHDYQMPDSVLCVGRAGAGVNNIPVKKCTEKGIVVFNTPGANANAVKELVICALNLGSRKIVEGIEWTLSLKGQEDAAQLVEKGKNKFIGQELFGKKIGIVGLGAIGALVANTCVDLGMTVYGYDPFISIDAAWGLNQNVIRETDINNIYANCDYISLHVPLVADTKYLLNAETFAMCKPNAVIINCSRAELVDNNALIKTLSENRLGKYITDFPCGSIIGVPNVICIPHLGASTPEAEDNCASMAARQIVDYIDNGNISNSVNFPPCSIRRRGKKRLTVMHKNVRNVLNYVTELIGNDGVNISNMLSQAQDDFAYAILDLDDNLNTKTINEICEYKDIVRIRVL